MCVVVATSPAGVSVQIYFAFAFKRPNNLNAEVNLHRCSSEIMVEEAIMPVDAQALVASEKFPDEIQSRLPRARDVSHPHTPPHRGERLRAYGLSDDLIVHRSDVLNSV